MAIKSVRLGYRVHDFVWSLIGQRWLATEYLRACIGPKMFDINYLPHIDKHYRYLRRYYAILYHIELFRFQHTYRVNTEKDTPCTCSSRLRGKSEIYTKKILNPTHKCEQNKLYTFHRPIRKRPCIELNKMRIIFSSVKNHLFGLYILSIR